MWSKVRKKLIEMLPNCLKGKIDFQMTAYRFGWRSMDKGYQCQTKKLHYDIDHFFNTFREYLGIGGNLPKFLKSTIENNVEAISILNEK